MVSDFVIAAFFVGMWVPIATFAVAQMVITHRWLKRFNKRSGARV